jgi:hypothetical protein
MLNSLPPPPRGKKGWPWTKESNQPAPKKPDGEDWPRISIVTPSYNQGGYIEETIRSVLLQNYPNLEYIIIDGGSTDESVKIIKKYESWLTYWVSEPDRGQSHAINKGFERCSGDIYNWLCSDDILLTDALTTVAKEISLTEPAWVIGGSSVRDEVTNNCRSIPAPESFGMINFLAWGALWINQPSVFWNREIKERAGLINEHLNYCMDSDLWLRFYTLAVPNIMPKAISQYRYHSEAKTTPYSDQQALSQTELSQWILEKVCSASLPPTLAAERILAISTLQEEIAKLFRLRKHTVIGSLIRIWRAVVNNKLPI